MKYGYLINGTVIAVATADAYAKTHESVKDRWRTVPEAAVVGSKLVGTTWTHPEPEAPVTRKKLSRPEFKLQFTAAERIAIRTARDYAGEDVQALQVKAALNDFFDIVEDPALTFIDLELPQTQEGLSFLVTAGILTQQRKAEIEAGLPA